MSSVLVTGGCGFIGQYLVQQLRANNERVRVIDLACEPGIASGVEFIRGSILDPAVLDAAMADVTCVYHLAGHANLWRRARSDFELINARGTETLLHAAREKRVGRLVHCSTAAILQPAARNSNRLVDEEVRLTESDMAGPYTRSKYHAEQAAMTAAEQGMDVVIVNPTLPIGANDRNLTPPSAMLCSFLRGSTPAFLDCAFNLIDVRDIAAGMILANEHGRAGERYILGGENISMRKLLELIERLSGRRMPRQAIPPWIAFAAAAISEQAADWLTGTPPIATREGVRLALRSTAFDVGKARRELCFAPRPISEALRNAIQSILPLASQSK